MDTHPETRLLIGGVETPVDDLNWDLYQKTKPAEAVQVNEPFQVVTLEGTFDAKAGDYLMRGPAGELYSCDQTIFDDTYGEYHVGGVSGETNVYNVNDTEDSWWGDDTFMWLLWFLTAVVAIVLAAGLIWHTVDQHTHGYVEKQRTAAQLSRERAAIAASCQNDETPRICIERLIPPGQ